MTHFAPSNYKKGNSFQEKAASEFLKEIKIQPSARILDVGCGDGKITQEIAKMVPDGVIIGVDASTSMIQSAQKEHTASNMGFMVMDASKLIFKNQFDYVVSFFCLHWVKEQLQALKAIRNAMVPNGKTYLSFVRPIGPVFEVLNKQTLNPKWKEFFSEWVDPFQNFSKETYTAWLREASFKCDLEERTTELLAGYEECKTYLIGWVPHLKCLPESRHKEFLDEIMAPFVSRSGEKVEIKMSLYYFLVVEGFQKTASSSTSYTITL